MTSKYAGDNLSFIFSFFEMTGDNFSIMVNVLWDELGRGSFTNEKFEGRFGMSGWVAIRILMSTGSGVNIGSSILTI